jgi:hypothetical protein
MLCGNGDNPNCLTPDTGFVRRISMVRLIEYFFPAVRARLIPSEASHGETLFWLRRSFVSIVRGLVHQHAAEIATGNLRDLK